MATITALADRLRSEIGDIGKSFVHTFTTDGINNRYYVPYSPLDGINLSIVLDGSDVSTTVEVEEQTGYIVFDTTPAADLQVIVAGNYFRYFTNAEIQQYVTDAFKQHTAYHTDPYGRTMSFQTLPPLEEYPLIIQASTLALYTLATDAAFDIDIQAPDGVMIPRSERYRQLMQMIEVRKQQYKELCSQLGIGLYKIDVFSFRRISKTTNRYVPIYQPMEVDDRSTPIRVYVPIPTYGNVEKPPTIVTQDLYPYEGDPYEFTIVLDFDVTEYIAKSEIRLVAGAAPIITEFTIAYPDVGEADGEGLRTLRLSLTGEQTRELPGTSVYDVQLTSPDGVTHTYVRGKIFKTPEVTE